MRCVQRNGASEDCKDVVYRCGTPAVLTVLYSVLVALLFGYFLGTATYLRLAHNNLRTKPYNQMRIAHQMLRLQVRARLDTPLFLINLLTIDDLLSEPTIFYLV